MCILIKNGIVITMTGDVINPGSVLIEDKTIKGIYPAGKEPESLPENCKIINAEKKLIMPGLICAHHHLYSTMARGMGIPGEPAANFVEILERLWWRLDSRLNKDEIMLSALVPLVECIKNGTTTIIDHHASPSFRESSLDIIRNSVEEAGIRAALCYEVSDRNTVGAGIAENERFLQSLKENPSELVRGMVGLHASFTVSDETSKKCVELADKYNVGCHIHVAEDKADRDDSIKKYGVPVVKRLQNLGMTGEKSIFCHCIWIDDEEIDILSKTKTIAVHNPESNMNNAVGVAKVLKMLDKGVLVGLGTDGMSSDMIAQMRCAYLLHRLDNRDPRVAFCEAPALLLDNNREIVKRIFNIETGTLEKGKPADVIVVDYDPPTPLNKDNFLGHLIFGIVNASVDTTIVNGNILMENRNIVSLDEHYIMERCREAAPKLWERFQKD